MNSLEAGRQRAERLHAEVVSAGHDPRSPYEFVRAEATKRLIDVERVPKGDIRLHGGRALYDPDALLILHENSGDTFLDAFLVAHELGHIELGGQAEPMAVTDADPLRAAEAVPIGVERVVDYSRRQRREVQMDLFAREFLLPRSWLRELHVAQGMTASEIAAYARAPFPVVAQQLLDALLLPRIEIETEGEAPERPLAPDQAEAATHKGSPFLLEAGPGTGKTQTLVGRIEYLLTNGVDPEKILILTFSNKAAGELSERIGKKYPEAAAKMWAGTFHGFGLDIIRRFHDTLNLPVSPRLLDRSDAIELLESEYPKLNLAHFKNLWDPSETLGRILSAISRANDEVVGASEYQALAEKMRTAATTDEERIAAEKCLEVATAFTAYERLKAERGCVDFGDLVALPVRLCEAHPDIRAHLATAYEHILVDEYQDVNRASVRLLKAIAGDGKNLWAVGDVKQSIYRFRGASAYNMTRFGNEDFPGAKRGRLTTNYRSRQEVVTAYLKFAADIPSVRGSNINLKADRGACGHLPEYRAVTTSDDEIVAVSEAIEEFRKDGYSYRDQAILSSGNDRLGRFAEGLERLGIPVLYLGSLFERDEIKELLSVLLLIVDRRAMGLVRVAASDRWAVPLGDVASVLWHLKDQDGLPLAWVTNLDGVPGLTEEGREGLRKVAALADGFSINANPWDVLASVLLDRSRIAAEIAESSAVNARTQGIAIWQLMSFIRTQPPAKGLPITRLLERIRRMVQHGDEKDLRQLPTSAQGIDAVRLMTMHGSKGLEFDVVHIPGMVNGSLPRSPKSDLARSIIPPDGLIEGGGGKSLDALMTSISEEHECLFFVAMSRARDRLLLYSPTEKSGGTKWPRSSFIDRLGGTITESRISPKTSLPPSDSSLPVSLTFEADVILTDSQIALYQRCPRRFLYTHILEIGGRRSETAFMKMHNAVQKVIEATFAGEELEISRESFDAAFEEAWISHGPSDHGYAEEYKQIAVGLIRYLEESTNGFKVHRPPQLRFSIQGGEVVITPDQVVSHPDGQVIMRKVRTGHQSDKEKGGVAAAVFHLAATAHTPGCKVELVHLGDGEVTPIEMSARVLGNRKETLKTIADDLRTGEFPLKEDMACPRCPAFFICGRLPAGPLVKKFSS